MFLEFLIFHFFLVGTFAPCPNGMFQFLNDEETCYLLSSKPQAFLSAEETCVLNKGHLTSIHNMLENMFIIEEAQQNFTKSTNGEFWIGLTELLIPNSWKWMDKTSVDFTDWEKGQPDNFFNHNCTAIKLQNGFWISENCDELKPFVCKIIIPIKPTPSPCSDPWIYYDKTKSCYKILNNLSWEDANNACFKDGGGHLASIHSLDENTFITNLIPFNPNYHECFDPNLAWFGLYSVDKEASWNWIDNTHFNFSDWAPGRPSNSHGFDNCGFLHGTSCGASYGKWGDGLCDAKVGYSVCKKPAFS